MIKLSNREKNKKGGSYQYDYTISLGPWTSSSYLADPKHLLFVLARYKFAAKLLRGKKNILEIGCGDAFGTPIVAQETGKLTAIDIDPRIIESNRKRLSGFANIDFKVTDFRRDKIPGKFDGIYAIDVIEHIEKEFSSSFMNKIREIMIPDGICIIGTPNVNASRFASKPSREFHINLQSYESLRELSEKFFKNTLMFTMNDEVVLTGFAGMGHYLFSVGIGVK